MRITVLGKSPAWQDAGGACSCYLIEEDGFALVLDCGNGAFAKLRAARDYLDVDAVLISHLHADHCLDLVPFAYALGYSGRRRGENPGAPVPSDERSARPELHLPPEGSEALRQIVSSWGGEDLIARVFDVREYDPAATLEVGSFAVRFCAVPHYVPAFAVEVTSRSARSGRLTFSADCAPNEGLVEFARGTDLLLIEATLARPEPAAGRGHLTSREAGEHGARAGAGRLVLTHFSDELDVARVRSEAEDGFGGPVDLAVEGAVYAL